MKSSYIYLISSKQNLNSFINSTNNYKLHLYSIEHYISIALIIASIIFIFSYVLIKKNSYF